MLHSL